MTKLRENREALDSLGKEHEHKPHDTNALFQNPQSKPNLVRYSFFIRSLRGGHPGEGGHPRPWCLCARHREGGGGS